MMDSFIKAAAVALMVAAGAGVIFVFFAINAMLLAAQQ